MLESFMAVVGLALLISIGYCIARLDVEARVLPKLVKKAHDEAYALGKRHGAEQGFGEANALHLERRITLQDHREAVEESHAQGYRTALREIMARARVMLDEDDDE